MAPRGCVRGYACGGGRFRPPFPVLEHQNLPQTQILLTTFFTQPQGYCWSGASG